MGGPHCKVWCVKSTQFGDDFPRLSLWQRWRFITNQHGDDVVRITNKMMFQSEHERCSNIVTYGEHDDRPMVVFSFNTLFSDKLCLLNSDEFMICVFFIFVLGDLPRYHSWAVLGISTFSMFFLPKWEDKSRYFPLVSILIRIQLHLLDLSGCAVWYAVWSMLKHHLWHHLWHFIATSWRYNGG